MKDSPNFQARQSTNLREVVGFFQTLSTNIKAQVVVFFMSFFDGQK